MPSHRIPVALVPLVAAALLLSSCKGAEKICDPTDPFCDGGGGGGGGGGGATVANVVITSPIDSVMAVGRTVQMAASATDSDGGSVSTTFTWSSLTTSTATVNSSSGLVSAIAAGTTVLRATSSNNVHGDYAMRAVNADLSAVTSALTDPFAQALYGGLSSGPASAVNTLLATCSSYVTSGNIRAIDECLTELLNVSGADGNDNALLGVLALFLEHARRQLQL